VAVLFVAAFPLSADFVSSGGPAQPDAASWTPHPEIRIRGNANFTSAHGVVGGAGTAADPYRIEGWLIDRPNRGIEVTDADAHFVIRNVAITNVGVDGILFENVSNAAIETTTIKTVAEWGIRVEWSDHIRIANTYVTTANRSLLDVRFSSSIEVVSGQFYQAKEDGISILLVSNAILADNEIGAVDRGVVAGVSSDLTMRGNRISGNREGIRVGDSSRVVVEGNSILGNREAGLNLTATNGAVVSSNVLSANAADGLDLSDSKDVSLTGNQLSENGGSGIRLTRTERAHLYENRFTSDGLELQGNGAGWWDSHDIPLNNTVNGRPLRYERYCHDLDWEAPDAGQIILFGCSNVRIGNASIHHADIAILLSSSRRTLVTDAFLTGNSQAGIETIESYSLVVQFSNLSQNGRGADLRCNGCLLRNNSIYGNTVGVRVGPSPNVTVAWNAFLANRYGLLVVGGPTTEVHVHHNNFVGNGVQASDDGTSSSTWDSGYPSGGNYWSDYGGSDKCTGPAQDKCTQGDGIGDTPYPVGGTYVDRFPAMRPYDLITSKSAAPPASRLNPIWLGLGIAILVSAIGIGLVLLRRSRRGNRVRPRPPENP
jgi:parallel beta-helix repeat protein